MYIYKLDNNNMKLNKSYKVWYNRQNLFHFNK